MKDAKEKNKAGRSGGKEVPARTMSTAEGLVQALLDHGIDTIYGLPGLHNDPLFDAFHRAGRRLRVLHPRHEQAAAYMALGAAMATGRPQAFAVVPGPGLLNAGAALLTAAGTNAPVIALVGQIPQGDIDRGHGHLHEIYDQLGLARHIVKYAERIRAPAQAPEIVGQAIRAALGGRPGPAMIECAIDVWGKVGTMVFPPILAPARPPVDKVLVEQAAAILERAKRPLIVVGGGAQQAAREVQRLAERLEAPVLAYRRGQGVLPGDHPLAVTLPVGHRLWREADAVLGIGTRLHLQQSQWGVDDALPIIRIDIDPDEPARFHRPSVALIADAADGAAALERRLARAKLKRPSRAKEIAAHRAAVAPRLARLEPQKSFLAAMRRALPKDGIFIDEVTQIGFASRLLFPASGPRQFLSPGFQDNLGWGYGAALGVKASCPERPVLAIAGDGGFLYQAGELATARQHGLAVVVAVFDNAAFGNVRRIQEEQFGGRTIASDLANPDFVALAKSFGVRGLRAETPEALETAIVEAFAAAAPALIHVPCGTMPSPWDLILMERVRGG